MSKLQDLLRKYGASDEEVKNFVNDLTEMGEDNDDEIKNLIVDEIEAVESYDRAILLFNGNEKIVSRLEEIKNDELDHIRQLKELMFDEDHDDDITD